MGLGFMEIIIIGVAALVLLGPSRLPGLMRQVASIYVQLRRTSNEFKSAFDNVVENAEIEMLKKQSRDLSLGQLLETQSDQLMPPTAENVVPGQAQNSNDEIRPFKWETNEQILSGS